MAWWGVALVNGPHINNPMVDEAHARAAWDALAEARKRREKASDIAKAKGKYWKPCQYQGSAFQSRNTMKSGSSLWYTPSVPICRIRYMPIA